MHEITTKHVKAAGFLMLSMAALAYVYQYGTSLERTYPTRTFTVQGEADLETKNDLAYFTATVMTEGEGDVARLQAENTEKMNRINAFLSEAGVEKTDLKTTDYAVNPRYEYPECKMGGTCPPPTIKGYSISQSLNVKVRDVSKAGELLAGVVPAGANSVSGLSFMTDDSSLARDEARVAAMEDARKRAFAIAEAGGFKVGRLVTFYEDANGPVEPYMAMGGDVAMAETKSSVPPTPVIEPGVATGKVRVSVTYEIR